MDFLIREYYNQLEPDCFTNCDNITPLAHDCMSCFQLQFFNGNDISYSCPEKRKLYLLRYFPAHAAENESGMRRIPCETIDAWFECGTVRILSVGGGPGCDVYGALKFLAEEAHIRGEAISVDLTRVDIEDLWDEEFNDVMEHFFPDVEFQLLHFDVNDGFDSFEGDEFDLVIASYLISELSADECLALAREIDFVLADVGGIIINDRPESAVEENIRSMFERISVGFDEDRLTGWAGFSYPEDICEDLNPSPKFMMKSSVFVGVRE